VLHQRHAAGSGLLPSRARSVLSVCVFGSERPTAAKQAAAACTMFASWGHPRDRSWIALQHAFRREGGVSRGADEVGGGGEIVSCTAGSSGAALTSVVGRSVSRVGSCESAGSRVALSVPESSVSRAAGGRSATFPTGAFAGQAISTPERMLHSKRFDTWPSVSG
jgi:hypothetical protein